jgi:hypothetical protein
VRELNIDWAALHSAFQMNMPEVRCFLSLEDGKVHKLAPGDPVAAKLKSSPEIYIPIEAIPSRIQYQWLDTFIKSVDDPTVRGRMEAAVNGKGAFRRFKDILLTLPDERRRWFEFRDKLLRERLVDWVRELGVQALNEPNWVANPAAVAAEPAPANNAADLDALRDHLIAWAHGRPAAEAVAPLSLESLAQDIGEHFKVKARK